MIDINQKLFSGLLIFAIFAFIFITCSEEEETKCRHDWIWVTDTEATTTTEGLEREDCSKCGVKSGKTRPIPIIYTHSFRYVVTTPATTESEGLETWTCLSCGVTTDDTRIIPAVCTVYISGHMGKIEGSGRQIIDSRKACYWKYDGTNIIRIDLSNVTSVATDIITDDLGNVYITGWYETGGTFTYIYGTGSYTSNIRKACYWKDNGTTITRTDLPDDGFFASSIAIDSGIIYIAGRSYNFEDRRSFSLCYWKDDGSTITTKTFPGDDGFSYFFYEHLGNNEDVISIAVDDSGNVYITYNYTYDYSQGSNRRAAYWKDDGTNITEILLDDLWVYDIAIFNGDVYTVGYTQDKYSYRKNGIRMVFEDFDSEDIYESVAIVINSGNVYALSNYGYIGYSGLISRGSLTGARQMIRGNGDYTKTTDVAVNYNQWYVVGYGTIYPHWGGGNFGGDKEAFFWNNNFKTEWYYPNQRITLPSNSAFTTATAIAIGRW